MSNPITVYTTRACGPCRRLKRQLSEAGIGFREVDLDARPDVGARIETLTGGLRIAPTVDVGGELLVNPSARQVAAALDGVAGA
jgi:mycoredoxin